MSLRGHLRLLGRHVFRGSDELALLGVDGAVAETGGGGLGDAEVDDLGRRLAVAHGDEHVGGLEVAVDDALLVRVLHRVADLHEEPEAFDCAQALAVAVLGDGHAGDVLHDEERAPFGRGAGVEDAGHAGVVHHGEGLAFGLEAGDDLLRVHAQLDDLERHAPTHRLGLLGEVDDAEAALAQRVEDAVAPDAFGRPLGRGVWTRRVGRGGRSRCCGALIH